MGMRISRLFKIFQKGHDRVIYLHDVNKAVRMEHCKPASWFYLFIAAI